MKLLFLTFIIHIGNMLYSQNRIFLNASNLFDSASEKNINRIRIPWGNHGRFLLVIKNDGTKTRIRKKDLWGFQKKDKKVLRFYQGNTYEIVDTIALVIIYKTYSPKPVYYFSESLESRALLLGKKKMIKILGIDRFIQLYKKSPLIRTLA